MRLAAGSLLMIAATLAAQELTPRQLFYESAAPPKPAPAAAPKPPPKAAPKKTAPPKRAKSEPKQESRPAPGAPPEAPAPKSDPPRVTNAAYTSAAERPLGLRYAIVKLANGAEQEVSPGATFHSGDQVRLKVEGNRDGYLYVISRGSSGVWKPLFPSLEINGGDNRIMSRRAQRLPSDTQAFTFDEQAGQEQLFVIYSAEPVKDVEALIPSLTAPEKQEPRPGPMIVASATALNDAFVSRLRNAYSRDLIVQTVTPTQPADASVPESAVYVVSKSGGRVVADIKLEHK